MLVLAVRGKEWFPTAGGVCDFADAYLCISRRPAQYPKGERGQGEGGARHQRGGQLGNNNALKHGFYSHSFTRSDLKRLEHNVQGELKDEEE
ncbi:MAG TPA: hypothetical protein VII97_09780, partial [Anaerolineales bacterium]